MEDSKSFDINNGADLAPQSVYDSFNSFILSSDRNVFFKMNARIDLFEKIKNVHGDIFEVGVFKGTGMMIWLKLLLLHTPHDYRKVVGFDFFSKDFVSTLEPHDQKGMAQVFARCDTSDISEESLRKTFLNAGIPKKKFDFVKGDIQVTAKEYLEKNPGTKISLLYLDVDTDDPTYSALCNFWDHISPGGIVVCDEYGFGCWTESKAIDRFCKDRKITLHKTNVPSPTAWFQKD